MAFSKMTRRQDGKVSETGHLVNSLNGKKKKWPVDQMTLSHF
jgi:hypothetical protein